MATVLEIIGGAMAERGGDAEAALSGDLPAWEADRRRVVRQAMLREAVDRGVFGRLEDYLADDDYEAEEGQRVYAGAGFFIVRSSCQEYYVRY